MFAKILLAGKLVYVVLFIVIVVSGLVACLLLKRPR
jgi:hypothetical protein